MKEIKGTGVALITPFTDDGNVDVESLKKLVEHQINGGTDFLVIMGTTGESATATSSEKQLIIDTIKGTNQGRLPLVIGIGGNNTASVTEAIKSFDFSGFSALLSVSPYYNKPNQEGIYHHYMAVADASPVPVILYNVPGRTGSSVSAKTTLRLAQHSNIVATKEASGNFDQIMEIIRDKPEGFLVLSGDDNLTLPFISMGMDGVISVICNAYPKEFSSMVGDALNNDYASSRANHYKLLGMINLIFEDGSPGGIKVALNEMGICQNVVRQPLHIVNKDLESRIRKEVNFMS
jgi:4-hydroxy-tetrahydrodipicolinate synthase